jgi:RND family efflux transporter MFP subunit
MTPRKRRSRRLAVAALAVPLLGAVPLGCDKAESTRLEEPPLPHVRPARVTLVQPRPESRHLVPLEPMRRARLAPRAGGEVTGLDVDEEQKVQEGQVLVRFAGANPRGGLISANASIARIKENLRDADRELKTARELAAKGVGTTREVERAETNKAALEAQLDEARGMLVQAKDRVGATTIVAPFDGVVTSVDIELGEYVAPGQLSVVIAQLDPIAVEVPLTQDEILQNDRGGLTFRVEARGKILEPELEWLASEADPASATFTARLKIGNTDAKLRAGELVDVEVFGSAQPKVTAVPATAIRWAADQAYVLKIDDTNTLARVDVTVADDSEDLVVIDGDVTPFDLVVAAGPIALLPGGKVELVDVPDDTLASR